MKTKYINCVLLIALAIVSCKNQDKKPSQTAENTAPKTERQEGKTTKSGKESEGEFVHPISHASMVLEWGGVVIYNDPVGDKERYKGCDAPNFILVSDIHGDHLSVETIEGLVTPSTQIIAPKAVVEKLPSALLSKTKLC